MTRRQMWGRMWGRTWGRTAWGWTRRPAVTTEAPKAAPTRARQRSLYFIDANGKLQSIQVRAGVTDGSFTEVRGDGVERLTSGNPLPRLQRLRDAREEVTYAPRFDRALASLEGGVAVTGAQGSEGGIRARRRGPSSGVGPGRGASRLSLPPFGLLSPAN